MHYLLFVVSLGAYLPLWVLQAGRTLQWQDSLQVRPWRFAVQILLPVFGGILVFQMALAAAGLAQVRDRAGPVPPWLLAGFSALLLTLYQAAILDYLVFGYLPHIALVGFFAMVFLLPLALVQIQRLIDAGEPAVQSPEWLSLRGRYGPRDLTPVAYVSALVGLFSFYSYTQSSTQDPPIAGQALAANQSVRGETDLYHLSVPAPGWVRVGLDEIYEGTDLSLYGPAKKSHLIVYVDCQTESIDERVEFRRGRYRDTVDELTIRERRVLMEEPFLPVSHSYYQGRLRATGRPIKSWIVTITGEDFIVEALGQTESGHEEAQTEALVGSLRIKPGAESC